MLRKIIGKLFGKGKSPAKSKTDSHASSHKKQDSSRKSPPARSGEKDSRGATQASRSERPASSHRSGQRGGSARPGRGPRGESSSSRGPRRGGGGRDRGGKFEEDRKPRPKAEEYVVPTAPAEPLEPPPAVDWESAFAKLGLAETVLQAAQKKGYTKPTPIQEQAIPVILEGGDLIGSAQTGTGKTAAFSLPLVTKLGAHGAGGPRVLVLAPTRELALQVADSFREYSIYSGLRIAILYGGVGYGQQRDALQNDPDVVVATPGRLLDFLEQKELFLDKIQHLVIDEADRMLDMGFIPDVKRIVSQMGKDRQTLLFSATIPPEIESLASWILREPRRIEVVRSFKPAETISHALYPVAKDQKFDLLMAILEKIDYKSVIIFTRTKVEADLIAARLGSSEHTVTVIHSDRSQRERVEALDGFKSGQYEVLVATDIAARGLDIAGVSHVINYSVPENPEDYVHRIGRTGRAEAEGDALTLFTAEEQPSVGAIEAKIGQKIPRSKLESFKYAYTVLLDPKALKQRKRR
ncbi:DEAD/DEAH box helicase [Kamptonema cortianum]|nr:DEAD/DEAH box helicase [Kamptonema cortianum]MDL5050094.1 DEAD/DEAH box helicase [Oscillatoria amoena NRMC-F 0135]